MTARQIEGEWMVSCDCDDSRSRDFDLKTGVQEPTVVARVFG